ncbi:MAG: ferrous iron transport protein B, partial [Bacteroidia bacterium]|nr:ferrous iron transport protein B [Bacteroidia bacterium]
MKPVKKLLLVGSPNSGKTTLFNALTGLHQKTANYAGVTIEKYIGRFSNNYGSFELIDLPGIYSLYPNSLDEQLAIDEILNSEYDGILLVMNADQLQKNLLLALQVLDLKKPTLLVLNMIDEAEKNHVQINQQKLAELTGIDVVCTNARTQQGINELKNKLNDLKISASYFYDILLFEKIFLSGTTKNYRDWIQKQLHNSSSSDDTIEKDLKYKSNLVKYICEKVLTSSSFIQKHKNSIDYYLTHKVYGFLFLIFTLLIVFQMVFFIAEYPMQWIEWSMSELSEQLKFILPRTEWAHLIINGVLPGITGVIMFVPQIALLFLMIGILEESGYMARISFLLDGIFSQFGLSGKSLIPLVSGVACAVPSILSTRTINNNKEKWITVMVLPFMSCSARLPVYTLLIGLLFPENNYYGFLNLKGLALLGLYLLGLIMALLFAFLYHKIVRFHQSHFFFIELPSYKIPYWKNLFMIVWNKVKIFITDAGKIIVAVSIVLWYLSSHSIPSIEKQLQEKYISLKHFYRNADSLEKSFQAELLEHSYAGMAGKWIEPAIRPLGYDWKIGISLITSFAAREVFVGTMATLYSTNGEDDVLTLRDKIKHAVYSDTQTPVFTKATSISLLIYYALAMQCISTMVVVYRELKSLKWVMVQFISMTG